jgi:hypothetical protein
VRACAPLLLLFFLQGRYAKRPHFLFSFFHFRSPYT